MKAQPSEALVSRLAQFARLTFSSEEMDSYASEFRDVVAYVDHIERAYVSHTSDVKTKSTQTVETLRDDATKPSDLADTLLKHVPGQDNNNSRGVGVPPVFDTASS